MRFNKGGNMHLEEIEIINKLDQNDKEKVVYFIKLLLTKSKYDKLKKEISERREEIKNKEILTHDEIWDKLNV